MMETVPAVNIPREDLDNVPTKHKFSAKIYIEMLG